MANGKEPTVSAALCWGSGVRDIVCMNLGVYTLTHASCYVSYILYKSVASALLLNPNITPVTELLLFLHFTNVKQRRQKNLMI